MDNIAIELAYYVFHHILDLNSRLGRNRVLNGKKEI